MRTRHAPRAHLKETLHQESCVKVKIFLGKMTISGKMAFFRKFQLIFLRKKIVAGLHLALITYSGAGTFFEQGGQKT